MILGYQLRLRRLNKPLWPAQTVSILYSGGDPMEFRDYHVKVQKACKGNCPAGTDICNN